MAAEESAVLIERFARIRSSARSYFDRTAEAIPSTVYLDRPYWLMLPLELRKVARDIIDELIVLAAEVSASVRRSPMLSEMDGIEVGHATKGMRAALRMSQYRHWDPQILHDEDVVLGVSPGGQSADVPASPGEAANLFDEWANHLEPILELVGAGPGEMRVAIVGSGLSAPAGYRPGTAFIMMWMQKAHPELDDVADTVKRCFAKFGIEALRADDIEHEDIITKRILDEIRTSEFLFADLSGERPSVYYEVGYAHAIGRRVMLFRKAETPIHFDLAAYNCPEYANLRVLEDLVTRRLEHATGQRPRSVPR